MGQAGGVVVVLVGLVVVLFGVGGEGKRPELVGSSVWYTNATFLNVNFDAAVVQLVCFLLKTWCLCCDDRDDGWGHLSLFFFFF